MPDIIVQSSVPMLPSPAIDISFRVATLADLPAIDALQKKYHKQLGFFPRAQMEGYLKSGWVVVAEGRHEGTACPEQRRREGRGERGEGRGNARSELAPCPCPLAPALLGYCASRDRYLKRDELGVIYQLCVDPGVQRKFVGAALLRAVFERAPYGCKLFCCWCAQDIAANYFWESMGFVPLAFRTGGRKGRAARREGKVDGVSSLAPCPSPLAPSSRAHIFWQKRIRQGDVSTPYWFPSQTGAGAIREDRIVLPIPPGVRWSDEMPRILPALPTPSNVEGSRVEGPEERHEGTELKRLPAPRKSRKSETATVRPSISLISTGGLRIGSAAQVVVMQQTTKSATPKPEKTPRSAAKNDPRMIAAAREVRDRWLESLNRGEYQPQITGKYDIYRQLPAAQDGTEGSARQLLAA